MLRSFALVLALASVLSLGACTSISYKPALSLGPSPVKIPAKLQVETFVDHSPPEDKTKRALGVSATEPDTLAADLSTEVTNAVIADFLVNGVFVEAGKNITNPDAVMTGEIERFYGRAELNGAGVITLSPLILTWFLGLPMQSSEGGVDLEVSIRRPDGTWLGRTLAVRRSLTGSPCTTEWTSAWEQRSIRHSIRRCSRYAIGFSQTRTGFE